MVITLCNNMRGKESVTVQMMEHHNSSVILFEQWQWKASRYIPMRFFIETLLLEYKI